MIPEGYGKNPCQGYFEDQRCAGSKKNANEDKIGRFLWHITEPQSTQKKHVREQGSGFMDQIFYS